MKLTILLLCFVVVTTALNPLVIKGNKFFDSVTGQQFYVQGVDYQPSSDPIFDISGLQRDIPYLKNLGVNAIRCYQTDYTQNHDAGMQLLADNGIYVMIDLADPQFSIPSLFPSWSTLLFDFWRKKATAFAKYPNTMGFLAGNEVILPPLSSVSAAFVKAAIRDMKAWLRSQGYQTPVGYAAADVDVADQMQSYLDCGSKEESADFYGLNIYRWCGHATFESSGYASIVAKWATYSIPFIFTEFGCNTVATRPFTEIAAIYGPQMSNVLSGGFVYEYHQEANNYGLVQISGNSIQILPGYNELKSQWAAVNPSRANINSYTPTSGLQACPAVSDVWLSAAAPLPPTPNPLKCECMFQQLSCRLPTDNFNPYTFSQGESDALNNAETIVCNENKEWCWPVGVAPMFPSYGLYSDCNEYQKKSYIYNVRFLAHNSDPSTCQYAGLNMQIVTPSVPASTNCPATPNTNFAYESGVGGGSSTPPAYGTSTSGSSNSGNSGNSGSSGGSGSNGCGAGLSSCGTACYKTTDYCCYNNQELRPTGQCPTAPPTSAAVNDGNGAVPNTGSPNGPTGNNAAPTATNGASPTGAGTPTNRVTPTVPATAPSVPTSGNGNQGNTDGSGSLGTVGRAQQGDASRAMMSFVSVAALLFFLL